MESDRIFSVRGNSCLERQTEWSSGRDVPTNLTPHLSHNTLARNERLRINKRAQDEEQTEVKMTVCKATYM
jgi:hypothetical protein